MTTTPPLPAVYFLYQLLLGGINRKDCYTLKGFTNFSLLQMISLLDVTDFP